MMSTSEDVRAHPNTTSNGGNEAPAFSITKDPYGKVLSVANAHQNIWAFSGYYMGSK
jgi:hypothetical protein